MVISKQKKRITSAAGGVLAFAVEMREALMRGLTLGALGNYGKKWEPRVEG